MDVYYVEATVELFAWLFFFFFFTLMFLFFVTSAGRLDKFSL